MQSADPVLDEIEELFDRIDEDGDRHISFGEFRRLLLDMDHERPEAALRASFDAIDTDHDGRVSFDELRTWCR